MPSDKSAERELLEASFSGDLETVLKKLKEGADPNCVNSEGSTPLHLAAAWGHSSVVKNILKHGGNADNLGPSGWTPLHAACFFGHFETVRLLLKSGADTEVENDDGNIPGEEFSEQVVFVTCLRILTLLKLAASEHEDKDEVLGGSAESEDFAETLADKEEYQEMSENITQSFAANAPHFRASEQTLRLEEQHSEQTVRLEGFHSEARLKKDLSEHPIHQLWSARVEKPNRSCSRSFRRNKRNKPVSEDKCQRNAQTCSQAKSVSTQPVSKMHLFGFHEGRTKSALEKFIEGTIDTKDDGGHSLFSENFATRFGRRFGHKKEQDKSQQETEEKNYRNDEYSICSDEKPSEFLGDEYEHSQKILF